MSQFETECADHSGSASSEISARDLYEQDIHTAYSEGIRESTMSDELEKFRGLTETRWPKAGSVPAGAPSGSNRKALSRYINEYLAELDVSVPRRKSASTTPPDEWPYAKAKLPMSREEYMKKQNALFKELTGYESSSDMSSAQGSRDLQMEKLTTMLDLYLAALDEKVYLSADHSRAMLGVRDKLVREEFEQLRASHEKSPDKERDLLHSTAELRDLYRNLQYQHVNLAQEREALELEMSRLRQEHALEAAKRVRLEYVTHSLGQKLVKTVEELKDKTESAEDVQKRKRETLVLQSNYEALEERHSTLEDTLLELTKDLSAPKDLNQRIRFLYDELIKMKATERYEAKKAEPPTEPLDLLREVLVLIEIGRDERDRRLATLIEAFANQYRAREDELLTRTQKLEAEKRICLARCEKLETENSENHADLAYLEQRMLSLVLMLKGVRSSLNEMDGSEKDDEDNKDNNEAEEDAGDDSRMESS